MPWQSKNRRGSAAWVVSALGLPAQCTAPLLPATLRLRRILRIPCLLASPARLARSGCPGAGRALPPLSALRRIRVVMPRRPLDHAHPATCTCRWDAPFRFLAVLFYRRCLGRLPRILGAHAGGRGGGGGRGASPSALRSPPSTPPANGRGRPTAGAPFLRPPPDIDQRSTSPPDIDQTGQIDQHGRRLGAHAGGGGGGGVERPRAAGPVPTPPASGRGRPTAGARRPPPRPQPPPAARH